MNANEKLREALESAHDLSLDGRHEEARGVIREALADDDAARAHEIADANRVIAWATEKPRRPANSAFTAGAERQAAYWIEWAECRAAAPQLRADFERECADADKLLTLLGLDPERCRTDGGSLRVAKIVADLQAATRAAAPQGAEPLTDDELPGMWSHSDLTGGATDCASPPAAPTDAARGTMREAYDKWYAEATFETMGHEWTWAAWQAATRAAAPQSAEPVAYIHPLDLGQDCSVTAKPIGDEQLALYTAPPTAPTDAEWVEEAMRLADRYRCGEAPLAAARALHAHLSTRPAQAAPTEADRLDAGWQPIETAPKDGTRVLCVWACAWGEMVYEGWCQGVGTARDGGDFWRSHSLVPVSGRPTHWMPLPPPPIDAAMSAQAGGKEQGA